MMESAGSAQGSEGGTLASVISDRLRADVLAGRRDPGSRVLLEDLKSEFGVSWSPIREAVSRLVAEGVIVADGARHYRVAPASRSEISEILRLRVMLETAALRGAIEKGDDAWEAEVLASQHRLSKLENRRVEPEESEQWEARHRAYHEALTRPCDSPILLQFCHTLHDMNDRYRRIFLARFTVDRDVAAEHRAITSATLARDADRACDLLKSHIERTGRNILKLMPR
jgi:DNA-binding GntR family transcriptional regulator